MTVVIARGSGSAMEAKAGLAVDAINRPGSTTSAAAVVVVAVTNWERAVRRL